MEDQDKDVKATNEGNGETKKKRDAEVVKRFSAIIKFIRDNPDVDVLIPAGGEPSVVSGLDPDPATDAAETTVSADPTERVLDRHRLSELLSAGQRIGVQVRGHHQEAYTWAQAVQAYRNEFGL